MFKTISLFLAGLSLLASSTAGFAEEVAAPSATTLLTKADEYRSFKGKSFTFDSNSERSRTLYKSIV